MEKCTLYLKEHGCRCRREVEALEEVFLWVVLGCIALEHHSLGSTLLSNQQDSLLLLGNGVNEEGGTHVVHIGHQD